MSETRELLSTPPLLFWMLRKWECAGSDGVVHAVDGWELGRALCPPPDGDHEPQEDVPRKTACGAEAMVFWARAESDGKTYAIPLGWPVRVSLLPEGQVRCSDCWNLTGRKRPHKDWPA